MRYLRWKRARYSAPVAVVVAVAAGALVPTLSGASSPPAVPAQSAEQLLADVARAGPPELSGSLTWTANLGLSDLSTLEDGAGQSSTSSGFDPLSLLSGSYQIDVWLDGATAEHLALIEPQAQEVDLVRNGNQAWFWDSSRDRVTHFVGESQSGSTAAGGDSSGTGAAELTPDQLASRLLDKLGPSTSVTTGSPLYVAGEPAYQLLVSPKAASGSTVDHVEVDIGATAPLLGVPLQVAVYARSQTAPAIELGFTGVIHTGAPPASEMTFTPPPGATVVSHTLGTGATGTPPGGSDKTLTRIGTGWSTVVTGSSPQLRGAADAGSLSAVTAVVEIGDQEARLFNTSLLNVLVMPDGTYYAGFVTPDVLEAAASASS